MKRKIIYFIISCIFAIITSANNINQLEPPLKISSTHSSILSEGRKRDKDYITIIFNKVEPIKKIGIKSNFDEYNVLDFEDIEIEKNSIENDRLIEKKGVTPPYYTILYRYKTRVLRS